MQDAVTSPITAGFRNLQRNTDLQMGLSSLQDVNALEAILLPQATLNEIIVTSRGPQPAPYSRGLGLTREPSSGPDSPRAVADLGGSSLNLERRHAQGAHDLLLAADSQATHVAWLGEQQPQSLLSPHLFSKI